MSRARILFFLESPVSRRDYDRFGVEWLKRTFDVSMFDCTRWIKPSFWSQYSGLAYTHADYIEVDNIAAILDRLSGPEPKVAMDRLGVSRHSRRIRSELRKRNIPRAQFHGGLIPQDATTMNASRKNLLKNLLISPLSISRQVFYGIQLQLPDIVVLSGEYEEKSFPRVPHKIEAHSFDYDLYLENRGKRERTSPFAVFLDEDMVAHSDYKHSGVTSPVTREGYYTGINSFFVTFENVFEMPIVIASHPRHKVEPGIFNGREAIAGRTAELVRDAAVVLCHQSTSVSFAVLWRKPVLCLTTNELMNGIYDLRIQLLSRLLKAPLLNINTQGDRLGRLRPLQVDEPAYANYVRRYIKMPGSAEIPSWQIFSEYVERYITRNA